MTVALAPESIAEGIAIMASPRKATNQPGVAVTVADNVAATIDAALAKVADAQKNTNAAWRVVSLGAVGTGAVGTVGIIERV